MYQPTNPDYNVLLNVLKLSVKTLKVDGIILNKNKNTIVQ